MLSYKRFKTALIKKSLTYDQAKELLSDKSNWHLVYQLSKDTEITPSINYVVPITYTFGKYTEIFHRYFLRLPYGLSSFANQNAGDMEQFLENTSYEYLTYNMMPYEEQHRLFNANIFDFSNPTMTIRSELIPNVVKGRMNLEFPAQTEFLVNNILYLGQNPTNLNRRTFAIVNKDASKPDIEFYADEDENISNYDLPWDSTYSFSQFVASPTVPGSEVSSTIVLQSHFFDNKIIKELTGGVIKYRDRFGISYTTLNVASIITANSRTLNQVLDTYIHGNGFHILGSLSNGNAFVTRTTDFSTWSFHEQANSADVLLAYSDTEVLRLKQLRNTKIGEELVSLRECYTLNGTFWQKLPSDSPFPHIATLTMYGSHGEYYISNGTSIYLTTDFIDFKNADNGFYSTPVFSEKTPFPIETSSGTRVRGIFDDGNHQILPNMFTRDIGYYAFIDFYDANLDVTVVPEFLLLHNKMVLTIDATISLVLV